MRKTIVRPREPLKTKIKISVLRQPPFLDVPDRFMVKVQVSPVRLPRCFRLVSGVRLYLVPTVLITRTRIRGCIADVTAAAVVNQTLTPTEKPPPHAFGVRPGPECLCVQHENDPTR